METIIENLYAYFETCPLLGDAKINVDYLPETANEYTLDTITGEVIVRQYARGAALKQYLFAFGSRAFYSTEVLQNLQNSGFYEQFAGWLENQTKNKQFPLLPSGYTPRKIEAQTSGYLYGIDSKTARYQIQCRLLYYQEG